MPIFDIRVNDTFCVWRLCVRYHFMLSADFFFLNSSSLQQCSFGIKKFARSTWILQFSLSLLLPLRLLASVFCETSLFFQCTLLLFFFYLCSWFVIAMYWGDVFWYLIGCDFYVHSHSFSHCSTAAAAIANGNSNTQAVNNFNSVLYIYFFLGVCDGTDSFLKLWN